MIPKVKIDGADYSLTVEYKDYNSLIKASERLIQDISYFSGRDTFQVVADVIKAIVEREEEC